MSDVVNIKDARTMRALGLPLDCKVIEGGQLPKATQEAMNGGWKAAIAFRTRLESWVKNQNASSAAAMRRALQKLMRATDPEAAPDDLAFALLESEWRDVREQWLPILEQLEAGGPVSFSTHTLATMWPCVDSAATARRKAN